MIKYVIKRLLIMIPTLLCVAVLIFVLMNFIPGDPAELALGQEATEEEIQAYREVLGLNDPYFERLVKYIWNILTKFDFGLSYTYGTPVLPDLLDRFPYTLLVAIICCVMSAVIGIPLGVSQALKAGGIYDNVTMVLSLVFVSMPGFWLAQMLIVQFSLNWPILPSYGFETWDCYVLPCVANAMGGVAGLARQTRSSMLEVIRADYVTTARAKGLKRNRVTWHHALPNGLIPIITAVGSRFNGMMGGTLIMETIYSIPGLGSYMMKSINGRDYPAVQGAIVFVAALHAIVILIIDIIYAFADPRIRAQYVRTKKGAAHS